MCVLVKHHHNQDDEHTRHCEELTCAPSKDFKKQLLTLKYFQKVSLKNNTKNVYTPFTQIHQICLFVYFRYIGVTLLSKII